MPKGNEVRGSTAQERAQNVLGAVKTIESIGEKQKAERSGRTQASSGVSGFMKRFRHEPEPVVNHATALKLAGQDLEHRVTTQYGDWGWRMLKGRVPDLDHPAEIKDVSLLAMNIKQAVGDLQTLESAIEQFVSAPSVASLDPMGKARTFGEYQEKLLERAPVLADEFSPPSAGWTMACQMAGIAPREMKADAPVIKELVRASTRQFIQANGKLPSRMQMLEFAVLHANYVAGRSDMSMELYGSNRDALNIKEGREVLGFADFPTKNLREKVEGYASEAYEDVDNLLQKRLDVAQQLAAKSTVGGTDAYVKLQKQLSLLEQSLQSLPLFRKPGPVDLSADQPKAENLLDGGAVMRQSMQFVWSDLTAMDAGYQEALATALRVAAAECPMAPPPRKKGDPSANTASNVQALQRRLKDVMPGSRFFGYVASRAGEPQLGPQALNAYKRTLLDLLKKSWTPEDLKGGGGTAEDFKEDADASPGSAPAEDRPRLLTAEELANAVLKAAQSAYEEAQQQQLKSAQPMDPRTVRALEQTLQPPLAQQLAETGAVDAFVVASKEHQDEWLKWMEQAPQRPTNVAPSGYPTAFIQDLDRNDWVFETRDRQDLYQPNVVVPGDRKVMSIGSSTDTMLQAYQSFFAGHARAGQTLSHLVHQNGIGLLMRDWMYASYSIGHLGNGGNNMLWLEQTASVDPGRPAFEGGFTIRELPNGRVEVEFQQLRPATSLSLAPGVAAASLPINRGEHFDGKTTPENAALHQTFKVEFAMSDLDRGVIKPTFRQAPQTRIRILPDWGQIAQLREKGVLSFALT